MSSTLGVRLENRSLFTVKNLAADVFFLTCKVISAGCTTYNIYYRNTQYLQLKTSKTHMWFKYTCSGLNTLVVISWPVVRRLKNTWVCKHTLVVLAGIRSSRLELAAGNTETFFPSSAAGINPSCGNALNVADGPAYYRSPPG